MSNIFDDREKQFEAKYKHDQELRFKVTVRRNKLLGLWVAKEFGLKGAEADAYAKSVVEADFEKAGDEDVVGKVLADFKSRNIEISVHRLRKHFDECFEEARKQIMTEVK